MASGREVPAELQSDSAVPGSAEFLFSYLKGPGHDCGHFPKYRAARNHEYPSRLGFFHTSKSECTVAYLDTAKLCKSCLDFVVPLGYNYWSILSVHNQVGKGKPSTTTQESGHVERQKRWLDAPPSALRYPEFIQATAEQLPSEDLTARANVNQGPVIPTRVSIPQLTWASEAWQWLSSQRKPFYLDQLHMIKGWTPLAERMAERDFETAEKTGTSFTPTTERSRSKMSKSSRDRTEDPKPADNGATSTGSHDKTPKATRTTKTTRKKSPEDSRVPDPTATILIGHCPGSNATGDLPLSLPTDIGKQKLATSRIPKEKSTSSPKSAKTGIPSPDPTKRSVKHTLGAKKSDNASSKPQKKPEPRDDERVSTLAKINPGIGLISKPYQLQEYSTQPVIPHTRNYNRYEPLPFDSPVNPATLGNYKRGVGAAVVITQSSPTRLPLELVLGEDYSSARRSKDLLRGPESSANEEDILALVGSRGPSKEAGPESSLEFIEAAVKAKSKVPAASKKIGRPSLSYDRPSKAEKPKSSVVSTESLRDRSAQKASATPKTDRSSLHNDKPRKVGSTDQSRDKSTQKVSATSKTNKPSSQHDQPPKADTPKSKVVSPELPRDKSTQRVPATSKRDKSYLQHDKPRKVEAPKSGVVSQKSPQGKSAQTTSKTGTRSGEANAKKKTSEKARAGDKASKKPPNPKRSDPKSKQAPRGKGKDQSNRRQGNKQRPEKSSGDGPATAAAKSSASGRNEDDAEVPDTEGEGNSGEDQSEEEPSDDAEVPDTEGEGNSGEDQSEEDPSDDDDQPDSESDNDGEEGSGNEDEPSNNDGEDDDDEESDNDDGSDDDEEGSDNEDGSDNDDNDDGGSDDDDGKSSDENEGSNNEDSDEEDNDEENDGDEGGSGDNEGSNDDDNNDDKEGSNDNDDDENGDDNEDEGSGDNEDSDDNDNKSSDDNEGSDDDKGSGNEEGSGDEDGSGDDEGSGEEDASADEEAESDSGSRSAGESEDQESDNDV